jgi:hypothetical protein
MDSYLVERPQWNIYLNEKRLEDMIAHRERWAVGGGNIIGWTFTVQREI